VAAKLLALAALGALALAAPAAADQELIHHRVAIGKVALGMHIPEVRRLLGSPRTVNRREARGQNRYLEYDWDYGWWTVGFAKPPGGIFRAVLVATVRRSERTPERLGVGSSEAELKRSLGDLFCRDVYAGRGWGNVPWHECVYGRRGGRQTVFVYHLTSGATEVQVRDPLYYAGWKVRFEPR
jgi:hypothetical protein